MRLIPTFALSAILFATPGLTLSALAQDAGTPAAGPSAGEAPASPATPPATPVPGPAITAQDIGPTIDRDIWCAIALSLSARSAELRADAAAAMTDQQASQVLFGSVVVAMQANGNTEQDFNQLSSSYTERMLDPFASATEGFSREDCEAAIPEAQAAIDAAAEAAEAAQPAPDAAPAVPATPDAPAGSAPEADAPGTDGDADAAPEAGSDAATPSR
jgi:hypothetical protein